MNELRTLLTGRGLVESPRWPGVNPSNRLYFSDWSAGEVIAIDLDGNHEVVATVASLPLCTAFLPDGTLLIVDSPNGKLLRQDLTTYADLGRPGWNDTAVDRWGNVYVNRAGFNPMAGESPKPGGVHVVTPDGTDGTVREVADDIAFPNGMVVTGDTLIVADSYRHTLLAFDTHQDGTLTNRRTWADLGTGTPDGICADADGAIWYADVPNQWCQRVAEGGEVLDTIQLDRGGFACELGGPQGTTLFIVTARWQGMTGPEPVVPGSGQVLSVDVAVPAKVRS
ncbi:SMP-30/gluconolactonase/LRE family protein [Actinocrispum sp. NPDC049592]|uniref:SMP-30/gluconolactonase/LRE family protein n=1 Tax=Actinocrispum sp. NPDC049592 TaxID=3154835 RepID=UPI0034362F93